MIHVNIKLKIFPFSLFLVCAKYYVFIHENFIETTLIPSGFWVRRAINKLYALNFSFPFLFSRKQIMKIYSIVASDKKNEKPSFFIKESPR